MRLVDVALRSQAGLARLTGVVELRPGSGPRELYFEFPDRIAPFVAESADPFAAAMLVPSMAAGQDLEILPPISPQLRASLPRIRDVMHVWYPELSSVAVTTRPQLAPPPRRAEGAAAFFSAGVDSFYTLLKYRQGAEGLPVPLSHVIFMRGIENELQWSHDVEASQRHVEEIAAATGVACIVGTTNLRTELRLHWERYHHGAGLAATALVLSGGLGYVCIPASFPYGYLVRHGSTPLVDAMYSTERLSVIHDGAECTRAEKVARLVEWDRELVLAHLRVCLRNDGGAFNCGECYKCVRTAMALAIVGGLDGAQLFRNRSRAHWPELLAKDNLEFIEENLALARKRNADPHLIALLDRTARRIRLERALLAVVYDSPLRHLRPLVRRLRRGLSRLRRGG